MSSRPEPAADAAPTLELDAVIVGAGFSGLYLLHRLRALGLRAAIVEAASDVGGTWYWNRYPGARCDVESMTYSYSFSSDLEQEWSWSERYATQPEILRYVGYVADRFDLRRDILFDTRVTRATFDEATGRWTLEAGHETRLSARWCVMATGCLSVPKFPDFPGLDSFRGDWYHTGAWPHEPVDFTGKRVGVIGTGSTAIQAIPVIARQAAQVTVFQRTPNFSVPAWHGPLDPETQRRHKARYAELRSLARTTSNGDIWEPYERLASELTREEVERELESRWNHGGFTFLVAFEDLLTDERVNAIAADFVRAKIRESVRDEAVAELLCPTDHPFGSKRLCVDSDYYATYNRENVALVDVRSAPIEEITPTGLRTAAAEYELDTIVFAIGFDAMTGALLDIDVRGRGAATLAAKWAEGPRSYLGLAMAGFPNLFTVTGPGSPSVLSNMMVSIEQHVDWIADCLAYLEEQGIETIEADQQAEDDWVAHVAEVGNSTLFPRANSWYVGANVPGKPRVFMPYVGGVGRYRERCDEIVANGYEGFTLTRRATSAA